VRVGDGLATGCSSPARRRSVTAPGHGMAAGMAPGWASRSGIGRAAGRRRFRRLLGPGSRGPRQAAADRGWSAVVRGGPRWSAWAADTSAAHAG